MKKICLLFHPPDNKSLYQAVAYFCPHLKRVLNNKFILGNKAILNILPPFEYFSIPSLNINGNQVAISTIFVPLLPEQLLFDNHGKTINKILQALSLAEKKKVDLVALAGFLSITTDQGGELVQHTSLKITSGNSYTAALCLESLMLLVHELGINLAGTTVSIIGATGDIGSACAKYLATKVNKIILCSRKIKNEDCLVTEIRKLSGKCPEVMQNARESARRADIIIIASSAYFPIVQSEDIRPGCVVCDISIPSVIARDIVEKRQDVLAYEGGRAKFEVYPQINNERWKFLFPYNSIFGCFAEALILGLEGRLENYSLGRGKIDLAKVFEILEMGKKYGFAPADYRSAQHVYTRDYIKKFGLYLKNVHQP